MEKQNNGRLAYKKFGFRYLNVHCWTLEAEDHKRVMYGVQVWRVCIEFSLYSNTEK